MQARGWAPASGKGLIFAQRCPLLAQALPGVMSSSRMLLTMIAVPLVFAHSEYNKSVTVFERWDPKMFERWEIPMSFQLTWVRLGCPRRIAMNIWGASER